MRYNVKRYQLSSYLYMHQRLGQYFNLTMELNLNAFIQKAMIRHSENTYNIDKPALCRRVLLKYRTAVTSKKTLFHGKMLFMLCSTLFILI